MAHKNGEMATGEAATCLACGKRFKKDEYSVQCTVCRLWIHKQCAVMTKDLFNFLDEQHKQTGTAYWACRSCTAYAEGMNHRMKEIENKIEEVKQFCTRNEGEIKKRWSQGWRSWRRRWKSR
jgi:hypothetical protein